MGDARDLPEISGLACLWIDKRIPHGRHSWKWTAVTRTCPGVPETEPAPGQATAEAELAIEQLAVRDKAPMAADDGLRGRGASACRRFELIRDEDETGISGTGIVAYGVMFPDGKVVLRWDTKVNSTALYDSIADLEAIHGHGGKTRVAWLDYDPSPGAEVERLRRVVERLRDEWDELNAAVERVREAAHSCDMHRTDLVNASLFILGRLDMADQVLQYGLREHLDTPGGPATATGGDV